MEVEEIQTQPPSSKFCRVNNNGRTDSSKIGQKDHQHADDEEEGDLSSKRPNLSTAMVVSGAGDAVNANRLRGWHQSRIIRVARASGGKDRHSKVWTSKGLRDRRVRLSVTTAIQFYDLQDRLGYDQPSKAVEWLIKAAADAINELPSLNGSFPETPKQLSDEKRASDGAEQGFDSADVELEDPNFNQNQSQHLSLSKSACSSTSDTSKGSGLSLLKSDVRVNRVKARERARERAAKEKEKDSESRNLSHQQSMNHPPISQNSSFTELLTAGISSVSNNNTNAAVTAAASSPSGSEVNLFHHKAEVAAARQWPLFPMEYFGSSGLLGPSTSRTTHQPYSGQIQLGNSITQAMPMPIPSFNFSGENHHQQEHQQLQHFPFVSDHLIPVAATTQSSGPSGDYDLNFTMSSGLAAGFNRGTLQSNSSSQSLFMPPHLQRFSASTNSPMDVSTNVPFFIGAAAAPPPSMENNQHYHQFPPGLHLYGDGRHSDQKPKEKN